MSSTLTKPTYLAKLNPHPFDARIQFEEETHTYTIDGDSTYTSVTTFVHHHFPPFEPHLTIPSLLAESREFSGKIYPNKSPYRKQAVANIQEKLVALGEPAEKAVEYLNDTQSQYYKQEYDGIIQQWSETSKLGTRTHADIESFYNKLPVENDTKEYEYFEAFNRDFEASHPTYRPYRTEWTVFYKSLKLAGSIDMIYENTEDGTLMIYDWKRVKEIAYEAFKGKTATSPCLPDMPDCNFWHYSLQLNTYKAILEAEYGKKVTKLMLVRLYPDAPTYELHECADLSYEVNLLFEERKNELA
jgi:hypothetical protein